MAYRGAYNASKYAIEGIADTLRLELYGTDISVILIEPGLIESRFRANAYQAFQHWVNPKESVHQAQYQAMIERLTANEKVAPFTLPAQAVAEVVEKALKARYPKARYAVTFPTKLFACLKRLLPVSWLDAVLRSAGGSGKR
jgi:NAD(P)-dependent dehydrogenase (short-subunit alcohol dehydrogenase family)